MKNVREEKGIKIQRVDLRESRSGHATTYHFTIVLSYPRPNYYEIVVPVTADTAPIHIVLHEQLKSETLIESLHTEGRSVKFAGYMVGDMEKTLKPEDNQK
jgi:hypothetical protein